MLDAELGPGLKALKHRPGKFVEFGEPEVGEGVFVGLDLIALQFDEVDDTEVDLTYGIGVIVEQGDHLIGVGYLEHEFFMELPFNGGMVRIGSRATLTGVDRVDMTTDAHGAKRVKPGFASCLAAGVVEHA
jgi:hypothetical protein